MNKGCHSGPLTLLTTGATGHFLSAYQKSASGEKDTDPPRTLVSLKSTWSQPNMRQVMPTGVWSKSSCWDLEDLEATVRRTLVPCRAHQVPPGATGCHVLSWSGKQQLGNK